MTAHSQPGPLVGADRLVTLPDGRMVSAWEGGDPYGDPVLYHSGTPSGRLQAMLGHEAAARAGVRLISVNRPGYGASSDLPPGLAQVGRDALAVLDQYDVDGCAVLGVSGGGPYALATGLADQSRITTVGVAAGIGPWSLIDDVDDNPERALLQQAAAGDLHGAAAGLAALAVQEFAWLVPGLTDEQICEGFFAGLPAVATAWLDEAGRHRWAADTRDALARLDGYVRDNLSWGGPWDLDLGGLEVPCVLWYGEEDVVVPPAHGAWLQARLPRSDLEIRAGEGHGAVLFGRWDDVFAALTDRSGQLPV